MGRILGSGLTLLANGGGLPPENTVAPSISATSTIGTQISGDDGTWTSPQAYTYQWQRNTGSWVNIGGATSKNYTPVDADFGYALRLVVTTGGVSANSNGTNLTQEAPVQTLGSEVVTNGVFAVDTNWTKGGGWTISAGAAHSAAGAGTNLLQNALVVGTFYEFVYDLLNFSGGNERLFAGTANGTLRAANATYVELLRALATTNTGIFSNGFTGDIDNFSAKPITPNDPLTAPSTNMRPTCYYTLPASPRAGDQLWLMSRISDLAAGNYWVAVLEYTGTQWNVTLFSVATNTRTSRASATNIGSTNGMRVNMNGDNIMVETTANGGSVWTQRGSTISNSLYNTATGVNVLANSSFALGNLSYEPAA